MKAFIKKGCNVMALFKNNAFQGGRYLDITDRESVFDMVRKFKPAVIIHPAANVNVDFCQDHQDEARRVNVEGTRNLVEAGLTVGARFVFFSTDYVFDGERGPYSENDPTGPCNFYGQTKLEAENLIIQSDVHHLILRLTLIIGNRSKFVRNLESYLKKGQAVKCPINVYANPITLERLTGMVVKLVDLEAEGLFHLGGEEYISRAALARKIAEQKGLDQSLIQECPFVELGKSASRPLRGGLKTDKIKARYPDGYCLSKTDKTKQDRTGDYYIPVSMDGSSVRIPYPVKYVRMTGDLVSGRAMRKQAGAVDSFLMAQDGEPLFLPLYDKYWRSLDPREKRVIEDSLEELADSPDRRLFLKLIDQGSSSLSRQEKMRLVRFGNPHSPLTARFLSWVIENELRPSPARRVAVDIVKYEALSLAVQIKFVNRGEISNKAIVSADFVKGVSDILIGGPLMQGNMGQIFLRTLRLELRRGFSSRPNFQVMPVREKSGRLGLAGAGVLIPEKMLLEEVEKTRRKSPEKVPVVIVLDVGGTKLGIAAQVIGKNNRVTSRLIRVREYLIDSSADPVQYYCRVAQIISETRQGLIDSGFALVDIIALGHPGGKMSDGTTAPGSVSNMGDGYNFEGIDPAAMIIAAVGRLGIKTKAAWNNDALVQGAQAYRSVRRGTAGCLRNKKLLYLGMGTGLGAAFFEIDGHGNIGVYSAAEIHPENRILPYMRWVHESAFPVSDLRAVVFDWDGTVQIERSKWIDIATEVMMPAFFPAGNWNRQDLQDVRTIVEANRGKMQLEQFEILVGEARRRGNREVRTPGYYRDIYLSKWKQYLAGQTAIWQRKSPLVRGVREFMDRLDQAGIRIYVLSGEEQNILEQMVTLLLLDVRFAGIFGSALSTHATRSKSDRLKKLKQKHGWITQGNLIMIGDGEYDILAAKEAEVSSVAVAPNADRRSVLSKTRPDLIIPHFQS